MATDGTERRAVKTYVPEYQKREWERHAEELGMSTSEFLRSMVQAGRRGFGEAGADAGAEASSGAADRGDTDSNPEEADSTDATPGVSVLETAVLDALREEPREFDELVDAIAVDIRSDIHDVLAQLRERGTVAHEPLEGGFRVAEDG